MRPIGTPNEPLRLIIINYMFKYSFEIKTDLGQSLKRKKKAILRLDVGKTCNNDFVSARSAFLRLVGAPNEFQRLIIIHYMFKYSFRIKKKRCWSNF